MATKKYPHINLPGAMLALRVQQRWGTKLPVMAMSAERLAHDCSDIVRTARALQRINLSECNVALSDQGERARHARKMRLRLTAETQIRKVMEGVGHIVEFNGDPRGPSITLALTGGYIIASLGHE